MGTETDTEMTFFPHWVGGLWRLSSPELAWSTQQDHMEVVLHLLVLLFHERKVRAFVDTSTSCLWATANNCKQKCGSLNVINVSI